jgi:hypothetical protein
MTTCLEVSDADTSATVRIAEKSPGASVGYALWLTILQLTIAVGVNLTIEESKVEFPKGKGGIKTYADPETLSGTPVNRNFCGTCGWWVQCIVVAGRAG